MYPLRLYTLVHVVMLNANQTQTEFKRIILSCASKTTQKSMLTQVNEEFMIFWWFICTHLFLSRQRSTLFKVYIPPPNIYIYAPVLSLTFCLEGKTFLTVEKSSATKIQLLFRHNSKVKRSLGLKTNKQKKNS